MSAEEEDPIEQTAAAGEIVPMPTRGQIFGDLGRAARLPPRRINMTVGTERYKVIMDWITAHEDDPDACDAMRAWVKAVLSGGAQVANGGFIKADAFDPPFHYAVVPGTNAMVTFYEKWTVPVRTITFVAVIDAP